jgi:hypothetical protein
MDAMTDQRKGYSESTARRVIEVYCVLQELEDVVTISAVAKRSWVSRSTARAVLRRECGWTPAQSRKAHRAGIRRGQLVQAVGGHQGLARGRQTMELQGWPNLHEAHGTLAAMGYPALRRGRATQAAQGWPRLIAAQASQADSGYTHLSKARANLAARGWPNWEKAHARLQALEFVPLLEGQRRRRKVGSIAIDDWHLRRGRSTRVAILEALRVLELKKQSHPESSLNGQASRDSRVTGHEVATYLHLHPTTVNAHLKQLRALGIIDQRNRVAPSAQ